jgi:hypothetical protein
MRKSRFKMKSNNAVSNPKSTKEILALIKTKETSRLTNTPLTRKKKN